MGKPDRQGRKFSLLLATGLGNAVAVNTWNTYTWEPAPTEADIIPPRAEGANPRQGAAAPKDGFHVLRHTYASITLEAGEPVVTSARWVRALLARDHPRLLCSLHAGGRKQGEGRFPLLRPAKVGRGSQG
ncbi:hypothetical protein [Streptomyces mirabilis]|uniref:hypothetical protein n=1 Tax=Streptomyces mirabilis TaxID=68239 RepID=UPI00381D3034